jgi:RNA polymerase sigma-70 factor (ECF subfamily)
MDFDDTGTDELLERARLGDRAALKDLLERHRSRLKRMVGIHMDDRLRRRFGSSDVVQEAMADAWRNLPSYVRDRPLPFYPWLRQFAWNRLVEFYRRHVQAQKRSLRREERHHVALPDQSAMELALTVLSGGETPSGELLREELRDRVRSVLSAMSERDREVLVLRHLEQLSAAEIAAVLGIREGTVRVRLLRALERFRKLWTSE